MLDIHNGKDHWRVIKIGEGVEDDAETLIYKTYHYVEQWRRRFNTFKDMPPKTQEVVSVLSMCETGGSIKGTGQKVSHDTFWVDDKPEILEEYEEEKRD